MKVGALARSTGISVRTLHHYDAIGLLEPSSRTPAGHRLYGHADIARLQQIQSLRIVGIPLDEIRRLLSGPGISPQGVIQLHLDRLREQITMQSRLVDRLRMLARHLDTAEDVTTADLCQIIEDMTKLDSYFTAEQVVEINTRGARADEARMAQVMAEWADIIPAVREHMTSGRAPTDPIVQALGVRWRALVHESTGGDQRIAANIRRMYVHEGPTLAERMVNAPDQEMFDYMGAVFAALPGGGPG